MRETRKTVRPALCRDDVPAVCLVPIAAAHQTGQDLIAAQLPLVSNMEVSYAGEFD
ncbi:hypothetical protein [Flavonifractor porci]|uniref:hypothetical protein n=1 Tax=Flavonifractor porci TaxID=3133422 RepID=UPI0030A5B008